MRERTHSGRAQLVVDWVLYFVAVIDFLLFEIWFSVPIAAIRISGLVLAVALGAIALFRRLSLLHWRKTGSVAAAIDVVAGAFLFFTMAMLLGLGHRLSFAIAMGILMLLSFVVILFSIFLHRHSRKPLQVVIGILASLGLGVGGGFFIYSNPTIDLVSHPFTFNSIVWSLALGGVMGVLLKVAEGDQNRNPEDTKTTAPQGG